MKSLNILLFTVHAFELNKKNNDCRITNEAVTRVYINIKTYFFNYSYLKYQKG